MWLVHLCLLAFLRVHLPSPGSRQYDRSPLRCRLRGRDLCDISRPLKPPEAPSANGAVGVQTLWRCLQSIFPDQRITGVRFLKLPRSEYITGQLNGNIDQQIALVCLCAILEVEWGHQGHDLWDISVYFSRGFGGRFWYSLTKYLKMWDKHWNTLKEDYFLKHLFDIFGNYSLFF